MGEYLHRLLYYYKKNGMRKTIRNTGVFLSRHLGIHSTVIFCAELLDFESSVEPGDEMAVSSWSTYSDINSDDLSSIRLHKDAKIFRRTAESRFSKHAQLWFLSVDGEAVGFAWTVEQYPVTGYYFPLPKKSILIFDQEVYPEYRGHGYNGILTRHILAEAKNSGMTHAYISIKEWNRQNLHSMKKTVFEPIGIATRRRILRREIVIWKKMKPDI